MRSPEVVPCRLGCTSGTPSFSSTWGCVLLHMHKLDTAMRPALIAPDPILMRRPPQFSGVQRKMQTKISGASLRTIFTASEIALLPRAGAWIQIRAMCTASVFQRDDDAEWRWPYQRESDVSSKHLLFIVSCIEGFGLSFCSSFIVECSFDNRVWQMMSSHVGDRARAVLQI